MARTLLLGRAGAGKTHACLDALTRALAAQKRALLLVPTYGQAEHLRTLLLDRAGGLSSRAIHTFSSLAEWGARQRLSAMVAAPVRDLTAAEILREWFPAAAAQAGFRAEFLVAVKELKEQGEEVGTTLDRARAHFPEGSRGRALFEAYARYVQALPGPDHEDLLVRTRNHLEREPYRLDLFLVDGFHDFTPVQRAILDALEGHARETTITLPLHAVSARTAASFEGYERRELQGNRRASGALAHVERSLCGPSTPVPPDETVSIIACASEEDEADRLARLIASSGRPFRDFLVVRRSFNGLHALYRAAFRRYDIPLRFFGSQPLGRTPAARAASLWLRRHKLSHAELLPLLRCPYLLDRPDPAEVDRFAQHLRERAQPPDLDAFPGIRRTLEREELLPFGLRDALIACPDGDEDLARAGAFLRALNLEIEASRDPEHLLRRIPLLQGAAPDRRHECVYAVGARDARQWEKPVVCVAGLTADAFPKPVRQDIFLRDEERAALARQQGLHLPLRRRGEEEERYLFYVALTRARERLVLTYAGFDEQGTARAPCPYLEQLCERFTPPLHRRVVQLSEQFVRPRDAVRRRDLLPIVADGLRHGSALAAALHDAGAVPRGLLAWPRRLALLRTRPIAGVGLTHLSPTGISTYEKCPFLFLVTRILGLRRPREPGPDAMLLGSIAHTTLERYVKERADPGALFDEVFTQELQGMRLGIQDEAARRLLRVAVVRAAQSIDLDRVIGTEKRIDPKIEGVRVLGRIDRIDRCGSGQLIVDYKTGGGKADRRQLDCYLLAEDDAVGAVFDWIRKGRRQGYVLEGTPLSERGVEVLSADEFEQRRNETRATIVATAEAVRAGRLAVHPREPEDCTRSKCEGYDLCRVARARWLAKAARG